MYMCLHKQSKHIAQQNRLHMYTSVQTLVMLLGVLRLAHALTRLRSTVVVLHTAVTAGNTERL